MLLKKKGSDEGNRLVVSSSTHRVYMCVCVCMMGPLFISFLMKMNLLWLVVSEVTWVCFACLCSAVWLLLLFIIKKTKYTQIMMMLMLLLLFRAERLWCRPTAAAVEMRRKFLSLFLCYSLYARCSVIITMSNVYCCTREIKSWGPFYFIFLRERRRGGCVQRHLFVSYSE